MNKLLFTLSILAVAFALHPRSISADMMNLPTQKAKCHRNVNPYARYKVLKAARIPAELLQIFNNFLVLVAVGRICIPARENAEILRGRALIVKASQESFDGRRNLPKDVKSFPLDRGRRLAGNIVHHAVDAPYFIDDAVRYLAKQFMRQMSPMRGHEVLRLHRA